VAESGNRIGGSRICARAAGAPPAGRPSASVLCPSGVGPVVCLVLLANEWASLPVLRAGEPEPVVVAV